MLLRNITAAERDVAWQLMAFVLELSRFDTDHDLRDRARFLTALMGLSDGDGQEGVGSGGEGRGEGLQRLHALARGVLLQGPVASTPSGDLAGTESLISPAEFDMGTLSLCVGHSGNKV